MMEEVAHRPSVEYMPPPLPPKIKQKSSTTFTHIGSDADPRLNISGFSDGLDRSLSSMHPLVLNSKSPTTVFVAATQAERDAAPEPAPAAPARHVVTIRINTDAQKSNAPKISSVHLKSETDFDLKYNELNKKNSSLVRLNVDESLPKIVEHNELQKADKDKPPYIYCNSYSLSSMANMVMSSGQCSPSDTLDSGTCSDLDSTPPPPLPKKKTTKSSANKKAVTVTLISPATNGNASNGEVDFEDNDSNISCDSLNSSELNGSVHTDESHCDEVNKKEKIEEDALTAPAMPAFAADSDDTDTVDSSFLPRGLLQDIRDRSVKLNTVETESDLKNDDASVEEANQNINANANISKESAELTSFRLVTQFNNDTRHTDASPTNGSKSPIISESTYEERKKDQARQQRICYSSNYFDADKYYDFHLNEKQFDEEKSVKRISGVSAKGVSEEEVEYFAGVKDYKSEEVPSTIRSSKGTIRGVKNRVRAGIATFLQIQSTTKSYKEKDAGKVVIYTTTMGIVRATYQRCVLVKKILRNLLVKYEERDVFMSTEYQDEIRDRMKSDQILVPQLFIDGQHVGDADTVEKLNESGDLRKMLKPYKSLDACNTCQVCGGFRLLPCRICKGSKKSLHRNHFTAEFVALKCMNCDEVGLIRCDACC